LFTRVSPPDLVAPATQILWWRLLAGPRWVDASAARRARVTGSALCCLVTAVLRFTLHVERWRDDSNYFEDDSISQSGRHVAATGDAPQRSEEAF
jgi:hypothetical protein